MELPAIVAELGADPDPLLAEAGMTRDYFLDPENSVLVVTVGRLLQRAVEVTGCRHLGLLIGRRTTVSSLGALGFLMKASATVGDALQALSTHLNVQDRGASIAVSTDGRCTSIHYTLLVSGVEAVEQIYAIAAAMGNGILRELCGDEWRPEEVRFSFSAHDTNLYRQAFEAPVRFNSERTSLVIPTSCLRRPLGTADPLLHRMMRDRIQLLQATAPSNLVEQVRQLLAAMVLLPSCSAVVLASRLGMAERTLYRRLEQEGASYQSLRDDACRNTAYELLGNTSKRAVEVAAILGYSDAAAFNRAFHRWSGTTPAAWKAARRESARQRN